VPRQRQVAVPRRHNWNDEVDRPMQNDAVDEGMDLGLVGVLTVSMLLKETLHLAGN
jgi:hypothetical protein